MSRGPDVIIPVEALFDVPEDRMLVGDEILNPEYHRCCIECGSLCRTTAARCFNCGGEFSMREPGPE